jgi:putative membrane protein
MSKRECGVTGAIATAVALLALASAPATAVSLSSAGPARPLPGDDRHAAIPVTQVEVVAAGSAALVPLMAADGAATELSPIEAIAAGSTEAAGPIDDLAFVVKATESGRKEKMAARDALPQLKDPALRRLAEMLAAHHDDANARLSKIAAARGWTVPVTRGEAPPPAGSASPDFDAKWTAEMIAGHERAIALYREQAKSGEDEDLRRYAREALPTLEQHLEWLRRLQK